MASLLHDGRVVRVIPTEAKVEDFPQFATMKDQKRASKNVQAIREGGALLKETIPLPLRRSCQDGLWLLLFGLYVLTTFVVAGMYCFHLRKDPFPGDKKPKPSDVLPEGEAMITGHQVAVLAVLAVVVALATSLLFVVLAQRAPKCVVWTSLVFSPVLLIVTGLATMPVGLIATALGALQLFIVFVCWRRYIPFTIKVMEAVATVIQEHPCMITVSFLGSVLSAVWLAATCAAFAGLVVATGRGHLTDPYGQKTDTENNVSHWMVFVFAFWLTWGTLVIGNWCHVTYCGVFGRWYFAGRGATSGESDTSASGDFLSPSLRVASTTSLGSICFGSLTVAVIRALQAVARSLMQEGQEDGNILLCLLGCVLTCLLDCIGDFVEYFNDWAYVQCAVRGVSFCEAAHITYSLMTCANMKYILADVLLNSVVSMGMIVIMLLSALLTCLAAFLIYGNFVILGAVLGGIVGAMGGGAAMAIINSGAKTLMACWAEDPAPLRESNPEMHEAFMEKLSEAAGWG